MDSTEIIFNLLMILIPSGVVFLTVFFILKMYFENEGKKREEDRKQKYSKELLPIQLQAYERVTLLITRIAFEPLLKRVYKPGMTVVQYRDALNANLIQEVEHNITQQIYVSTEAWNYLKAAQLETRKLIFAAASKLDEKKDGIELQQRILLVITKAEKLPADVALDFLKKEVHELF